MCLCTVLRGLVAGAPCFGSSGCKLTVLRSFSNLISLEQNTGDFSKVLWWFLPQTELLKTSQVPFFNQIELTKDHLMEKNILSSHLSASWPWKASCNILSVTNLQLSLSLPCCSAGLIRRYACSKKLTTSHTTICCRTACWKMFIVRAIIFLSNPCKKFVRRTRWTFPAQREDNEFTSAAARSLGFVLEKWRWNGNYDAAACR